MASTYRASAKDGGTSGTGNRTCALVPAVGDLFIVYCMASGNTNTTPTCSDDNGGSYDRLFASTVFDINNAGATQNVLSVFIRTSALANTTNTTVTVATGANDCAEIVIVAVAGSNIFGSTAVRSSGGITSTGGVHTATLNQTALTGNFCIAGYGDAGLGPASPSGFTQRQRGGQATPSNDLAVETSNSGFTGTAITWGASAGSPWGYAAFGLELKTLFVYTTTIDAVAFTLAAADIGSSRGSTTTIDAAAFALSFANIGSTIVFNHRTTISANALPMLLAFAEVESSINHPAPVLEEQTQTKLMFDSDGLVIRFVRGSLLR